MVQVFKLGKEEFLAFSSYFPSRESFGKLIEFIDYLAHCMKAKLEKKRNQICGIHSTVLQTRWQTKKRI